MSRLALRYLAPLAALALSACGGAADKFGSNSSSSGTPSGPVDTGPTTGSTGTGTIANRPVFFALDGTLQVVAGELDAAASTLDVDYRNADGESICSGIRPIDAATPLVPDDPELAVFGWWEVTLGESPCGPFGPDLARFGIGAWDPALTAAAAAANLDGATLYALYYQALPSDPVFVFGVTGTSEQFNLGYPPPVDAAPLPDGSYQLRTLYLLPVDPP